MIFAVRRKWSGADFARTRGGPGVQALRTKARPWRLKFFRAQPPAHFWFLFVRTKRNSPQGETLQTVSFGAYKRNGFWRIRS